MGLCLTPSPSYPPVVAQRIYVSTFGAQRPLTPGALKWSARDHPAAVSTLVASHDEDVRPDQLLMARRVLTGVLTRCCL